MNQLGLQAYYLPIVIFFSGLILSRGLFLFWKWFHRFFSQAKGASLYWDLFWICRYPACMSLFFISAYYSLEAAHLPLSALAFLSAFFTSISIFIWTRASLKGAKRSVVQAKKWAHKGEFVFKEKTLPLLEFLTKLFVIMGAIYSLLITWGVNVSAVFASAGILGVVLGFAAKDSLSNLFAGLFIMVDAPYKLGDYIILDGTERGYITEIGMRSTRLMTRDDIEVIIPNSIMGNSKIVNESGGEESRERIRLNIGVGYDTDVEKVRQVLEKVAIESEFVCKEPEPKVRFREFGDFSLKYQLLFWVKEPSLKGRAIDQLSESILKAFREHKLEIPYPKQTVYLHKQDH